MSIFSSALAWFKKEFSAANGTTIVAEAHSAQVAINILAPGLTLALQEAGLSEASSEVSQVATETVTDLGVITSLLTASQAGAANGPQVVAALNALKANLSALLVAGHIKNPQTLTTVTNVVNAFIAELEVAISEFSV